MRHPHSKKSASGNCVVKIKNAEPDKKNPIGAPNCGNIPYQARFPFGAFSVDSKIAPPHSPPNPNPCPNRNSASKSGAMMPIAA